MSMKTLYRSGSSKFLGGICGGLGEYLEVDPNIVRLVLIIILLLGFVTIFWPVFIIILYLAAWALLPEKPEAGESPEIKPSGPD
jgi:phage shock protein C